MGQVFTIVRENKNVEELLKVLSANQVELKEIVCIVRHTNGDINVIDGGSTFETKCSGLKMLDFMINKDLEMDDSVFEEDELEEEEE